MNTYQTIVIGAGSGGLTVAIGLAALGRKVALVEGRFIGGDCTNVGCVPSKALIHLVNEHEGRLAPDDILARVQERRNALRDTETEHVSHTENLELISGWATFSGPKTLAVQLNDGTQRKLSADNIVIATGSRPRHIEIAGLPVERTLTNESLFEQETAPRHLAIIGSGVIAMEMAFAFHKLGSQVTVVTRSARVLSPNIPEASQALHHALCERGIQVHYRATPSSYAETSETLHINSGDMPVTIGNVDKVLLAVGRVRNIDKLGLENSGVQVDAKRGILVNAWGQTSVPGVYAIGDVTPTSHFTHSANAQGRRVVQRIAFPYLPARGPEPLFPSATFSDPEVASVGMTPEEIGAKFHPELIKRIRIDLKDIDRGYTDEVQQGFIIVDAIRLSGRILGVTIVGPRASEMLSFFTMAITANISLYKMYKLVYPYPTFSNAVGKVADTFMRETLPAIKRELPTYLRYRFAAPPQTGAAPRAASGD